MAVSETSAANRLVDPLRREGTGEAHHKEGRDCYRDQVNRPRVARSADKIEMSGLAFVPIGVKAHDSGLIGDYSIITRIPRSRVYDMQPRYQRHRLITKACPSRPSTAEGRPVRLIDWW